MQVGLCCMKCAEYHCHLNWLHAALLIHDLPVACHACAGLLPILLALPDVGPAAARNVTLCWGEACAGFLLHPTALGGWWAACTAQQAAGAHTCPAHHHEMCSAWFGVVQVTGHLASLATERATSRVALSTPVCLSRCWATIPLSPSAPGRSIRVRSRRPAACGAGDVSVGVAQG